MDLSEFIPNTQELHAITAHLPVALSMIVTLSVVAALVSRTDREVLRCVASAVYSLLVASVYCAVHSC